MPKGQTLCKLEDVATDAHMLRLLARKRCTACDRLCGVKKCERCRLVVYCSKACQRQHWAQHKSVCAEARQMDLQRECTEDVD